MKATLAPVVFISHGSPHMTWKESTSSKFWVKFGQQALESNIKGVVYVGAHWEELDDRIRVATKPVPERLQMDMVDRSYWADYGIDVSQELAQKVIKLLRSYEFSDVEEDPTFDWHTDTITPSRWMFPKRTPPSTVVSLNARYNPITHVRIGRALGQLRKEGYLICCTGGAVHNLYRNNWPPLVLRGDNFQVWNPPKSWAVDFSRAVKDAVESNCGYELAGALVRLTTNPNYKDAHGSDDHYYPILVAAGATCEGKDFGKHMAQTWELGNMCNDQYQWGEWVPVEKAINV